MNPTPSTTNGHRDSPAHAAEQAARHVGDVATQEAGRVGDALHDWWSHRRDDARHTLDDARHRAALAGERTREAVRERPMASLLAAVAFGAVISGALIWLSGRAQRS
jgi:ElaB/YqjD/DUF883 family membrane-anchored ribosome-binding protein